MRSVLNRIFLKQQLPGEISEYVVTICYSIPEFGDNVEFLSAYCIKENKTPNLINLTFSEAFRQAHPNWAVKTMSVETNHSIRAPGKDF